MFIARTVGELKKLIADLPDDMKILVPSSDHSYYEAAVVVDEATYSKKYHHWSEHWEDIPLDKGDVKVDVLIVE